MESRTELTKSAQKRAEEIRVQLRNITSTSIKKGGWGRRSEEVPVVSPHPPDVQANMLTWLFTVSEVDGKVGKRGRCNIGEPQEGVWSSQVVPRVTSTHCHQLQDHQIFLYLSIEMKEMALVRERPTLLGVWTE
jgi:hypothetical protein